MNFMILPLVILHLCNELESKEEKREDKNKGYKTVENCISQAQINFDNCIQWKQHTKECERDKKQFLLQCKADIEETHISASIKQEIDATNNCEKQGELNFNQCLIWELNANKCESKRIEYLTRCITHKKSTPKQADVQNSKRKGNDIQTQRRQDIRRHKDGQNQRHQYNQRQKWQDNKRYRRQFTQRQRYQDKQKQNMQDNQRQREQLAQRQAYQKQKWQDNQKKRHQFTQKLNYHENQKLTWQDNQRKGREPTQKQDRQDNQKQKDEDTQKQERQDNQKQKDEDTQNQERQDNQIEQVTQTQRDEKRQIKNLTISEMAESNEKFRSHIDPRYTNEEKQMLKDFIMKDLDLKEESQTAINYRFSNEDKKSELSFENDLFPILEYAIFNQM